MSDTMTSPEKGENALSGMDGVDALGALKGKLEETPQETEAEEAEETEEAKAETEETDEQADESTEEDDGESDAEEEESEEIRITLPDGNEITAEEAAKGYLRESDYTRKMQKGKQELEQAQAQITEHVKGLEALYQELTLLQPNEPDWDKVAEEHGETEALKYQRNWDKRQKTIEKVKKELQTTQQHQLAKAQADAREKLISGELIPEWSDTKKFNDGLNTVGEYLTELGYPPELLAQLADPIAISLAEKARRYDELQKAKPEAKKVAKKKPKPLKPGSTTQKRTGQERDRQQAINKFRQTKTAEDGQAALARLRASAG